MQTKHPNQRVHPSSKSLLFVIAVVLIAILFFDRIDNPRLERFKLVLADKVLASTNSFVTPIREWTSRIYNFGFYNQAFEQNKQLRYELQEMKIWREIALQLEQKNARLMNLNNVKIDPRISYITANVVIKRDSYQRDMLLLNVGKKDGIKDGWAVIDELGLVGRIAGVSETISKVVLLSDKNSRIPVIIQPSAQHAILKGNGTLLPQLEFVSRADIIRSEDRVVTTGAGGILPAGLFVGRVSKDSEHNLNVKLAANYEHLEFLRVLKSYHLEPIEEIPPPFLIKSYDDYGNVKNNG